MADLIDQHPTVKLQPRMILKVDAPTGRGKTKLAIELLRKFFDDHPDGRAVWLTYRVVLALKASEELKQLGFIYYKNRNAFKSKRIVVQMESLHKWKHYGGSTPIALVLDETSSLCGHISSTTMSNCYLDFKNSMYQLASEDVAIVAMDAYWTDAANLFITEVFHLPIMHLGCTPLEREKVPVLITGSMKDFTAAIVNDLNNPTIKGVFLWAGGRNWLNRFLDFLVKATRLDMNEVMFVHADSLVSDKKKAGINPDESWNTKRLVACTPAITSGVSFTSPDWSVFVIGNPQIFSSAEILLQAAGRVRQPRNIVFTVLDWERHMMCKLPEELPEIKKMISSYKESKFAHIRRFLGLTELETEDNVIVRQMYDDPISKVIMTHIRTLFKDYNDPYFHLSEKLNSDIFDVNVDVQYEDGIDDNLEVVRPMQSGFYGFRGLETEELETFDLSGSSDCFSASFSQFPFDNILDPDIEPENFILDEQTCVNRFLAENSTSKFRAVDVRALKGFMKLFCSLSLFGNMFTDPYCSHQMDTIKYITQIGQQYTAYTEVYAHLISKNVINEMEFERLFYIFRFFQEEEELDISLMEREYQNEKRCALPTMNPSQTLENIIILTTLKYINYDFETMSCPVFEMNADNYKKFRDMAALYHADIQPAKLPLIRHLVDLNAQPILNPDYYACLKLVGKLIQAIMVVLGLPSPLGDIRKCKNNPPYYSQKMLNGSDYKLWLIYYFLSRRLRRHQGMNLVPSLLIPTLYYRFYDNTPWSTITDEEHENSLRFIDNLNFYERQKDITVFMNIPPSDRCNWIKGIISQEFELNFRLSSIMYVAPRRNKNKFEKPEVFVKKNIVCCFESDKKWDVCLITDEEEVEKEIREAISKNVAKDFLLFRFKHYVFYSRKRRQ